MQSIQRIQKSATKQFALVNFPRFFVYETEFKKLRIRELVNVNK